MKQDDDGRRYGDWQHNELRGDPNYYEKDPQATPWYKQTFWIIAFLIVLWPVGIVLCWMGRWPVWVKIIVTIVLALIVGYMIMGYISVLQATSG